MDFKEYAKYSGHHFLFKGVQYTVPGQAPKPIPHIQFSGTVTGVFLDDKSGIAIIEISNRTIMLLGKLFPIAKQIIIHSKDGPPYFYFDSGRIEGLDMISGELSIEE